jgi:transcriptional regulator with XRE-family HTH domain
VPVSRDKAYLKRFGANVRRVRAARGITQERLAELADLNVRNVQRIEAGEFSGLIETIKRLRSALKCSWEELLGR